MKCAFFIPFLGGDGRHGGGGGVLCQIALNWKTDSTHSKHASFCIVVHSLEKMGLIIIPDITSTKLGDAFKTTGLVNLVHWF